MERYVRSHRLIQQNRRKIKHTFMVFGVKDLNPSISKYSLQKSLKFCQNKSIYNPRIRKDYIPFSESLLFKEEETWMKKEGELFEVTMGAYNGAQTCELIGLFILYKFQ